MADQLNPHDNRAAQKLDAGRANLGALQRSSFSEDGNVRVETACAVHDYRYEREPITSADASDAAVGKEWNGKGFHGISAYGVFAGSGSSESYTLELWCKDERNDTWILVGSEASVTHRKEVHFPTGVRGRRFKLVVSSLTLGGYTNLTIRGSLE